MVSICFKSLNQKTINNLESLLEKNNIKNIIYTKRKFKIYYNLIIHFTGNNPSIFYKKLSDFFGQYIINNYEQKIIKSQLVLDFFYFSAIEQEEIFNILKYKLQEEMIRNKKIIILNKTINSHIINDKKIYVDGFINFRIFDYKNYLNTILETEIHEFIIQKEYIQYVDLLRDYIKEKNNNNENHAELIHLFYSNSEKTILDKNYNVITTTYEKKYLSDISFSENDFILNSILSLMPKEIILHTNNKDDNFIIFLQKIFENKINYCNNCSICQNNQIIINNNIDIKNN
ncbi:MAG: hypothetical protein IKE91_01555 [Clostridia bacterium]|nr:hypothetical protein [Clostridia bacterium]